MPRILQNETEMTLVLFGGKTWLYPKSSKDPKYPSRAEVKTEKINDPFVKQFVEQKKLTVLSLEAAMAKQEAAAVVVAAPVTTVTEVATPAPEPVHVALETAPAAVGTVEDEKTEVAVVEEAPVASSEEAPVVSNETTEETSDAPRHKKNKKNRG